MRIEAGAGIAGNRRTPACLWAGVSVFQGLSNHPQEDDLMANSCPPMQLRAADATQLMQAIHRAVVSGQFIRGRENTISQLMDHLSHARIVEDEEMPDSPAALGSHVRYEDCATGEARECRLVMPDQANGSRGQVSILSPLGAALIGHTANQVIAFEGSAGPAEIKIISVTSGALA